MKMALMIAAGLCLSVSGTFACEFQRSVQATQIDTTVVASVSVPQSEAVVLPEAAPTADTATVETAK